MIKKDGLQSDLKSALKSGDKIRLNTIRLVLTAIKLAEVEKMGPSHPRGRALGFE
jgi:uncharacterized protein YqeY